MSKTLLMIHGVGCGGDVWDRMKRDFAMAGWTCEAPTLYPELRTKDNPPDALADLTLSDYFDAATKTANEIAERDGEKPVVIGHSMGGMIAQTLAERGVVRGAIFLTPGCTKGMFTSPICGCSERSGASSKSVARTFRAVSSKWGPKGFSYGRPERRRQSPSRRDLCRRAV